LPSVLIIVRFFTHRSVGLLPCARNCARRVPAGRRAACGRGVAADGRAMVAVVLTAHASAVRWSQAGHHCSALLWRLTIGVIVSAIGSASRAP